MKGIDFFAKLFFVIPISGGILNLINTRLEISPDVGMIKNRMITLST